MQDGSRLGELFSELTSHIVERLTLILEQLEESKRLILIGGVPQLRMALLLLDNAAEILMHRQGKREFSRSRMYEKMRASMMCPRRDGMDAQRKQELENHIQNLKGHIIPLTRKKKLQKCFDEKVNYSIEKGELSSSVGQVLSMIHRYRNLAYHQERIRKETLQPVVPLLFEVVSDLLVALHAGGMSWTGGEDYSWFERHYGVSPWEVLDEKGRSAIRDCLRKDLSLELSHLRVELFSHLEQGLEDVISALDFIGENSGWGDSRDRVLKRVQFWKSPAGQFAGSQSLEAFEKALEKFVPEYTLRVLRDWHRNSEQLKCLDDKLTVFAEFASREQSLEPLEEVVHEAAAELEAAIQMETDRLRGK